MALIKNRKVVTDNWQRLEAAAGAPAALPPSGDLIVPLAVWLERRAELVARSGRNGVWLDSADDPACIALDLKHLALIAVNFPRFTDGRGYSIARLLRERYGWKDELRAVGDILRDQLLYLERSGFDAFDLAAGQYPDAALTAFGDFTEAYQANVSQPVPLFRRRRDTTAAS
jgi:uncharacterized protein (DUF934 family)